MKACKETCFGYNFAGKSKLDEDVFEKKKGHPCVQSHQNAPSPGTAIA